MNSSETPKRWWNDLPKWCAVFMLGAIFAALVCVVVVLAGCFGPTIKPDLHGGGGAGGHPTPFIADLRSITIPLAWACIVGGIAGIVASHWLGGLSAKTCGLVVAAGFGLIYAVNFLARFEWVIDVLAWCAVASMAIVAGHWIYNKIVGVEGAAPINLIPTFVRKWFAPKPPTTSP